jgi:ABC-type transport system involved in multi-copper enzyme maturation permease subunit
MRLPPLVERELRAAARRPAFFWSRGLLALVLGFQACELLNRYALSPKPVLRTVAGAPPVMVINRAMLLHDLAGLLFLATLLMGLLTADSISRERREGTLSLLLLTHVSPAQIVYGKLLACGLSCFLLLLGCLPALMVTVLAGGVSGAEAAMTGIALLNTLFVSLAAGLWMSAIFRERRYALAATFGLVAALAFGPELLGNAAFGLEAIPLARLLGLSGWMTAARDLLLFDLGPALSLLLHIRVPMRLPLLLNPAFLVWFVAMNAVGWALLHQARVALARNWQDEPQQHFRVPEPDDAWSLCGRAAPLPEGPAVAEAPGLAGARVSWLTNPRPWDADPIEWRVQHLRPAEGLIWLAIAIDFLAQFGALGSIFNTGSGIGEAWGLLSFAGVAVILFAGGLLAWAAARFFQETRQQQDLELLLTSPIGSRNILAGQWRVMRRALKWPLTVVLAMALPAGISLLCDLPDGRRDDIWFALPTFLIAVNLALEVIAVCWVGMCFGLRARSLMAAVTRTVVTAQLLPLALAVALMWGWVLLLDHSLSASRSRGSMPTVIPALLFFLIKNVVLIGWARLRLHRDLRLGTRTAQLDMSARRLVLQPA